MDNSQGWVIHERQLSRSSKQTKKPLPRGNLSGAYIGRTSAFHQSGIREPGPHPRGGGSSTVFFISRLCPKSSSGTLACGLALTEAQGKWHILAVAQGGGAGESVQRESCVGESSGVRLGMKFFSVPQELSLLARKQRSLEVTVGGGAEANSESCWRLCGGTLWAGRESSPLPPHLML